MLLPTRCALFALGLLFALWGPAPALALSVLVSLVIAQTTHDLIAGLFACLLGFAVGNHTWVQAQPVALETSMLVRVAKDTVDKSQSVILEHPAGRLQWSPRTRRYCAGTWLRMSGELRPPIAQAQHGKMAPFRHALAKGLLGRLQRTTQVKVVALPSSRSLALCHLRQGFADRIKQRVEARLRPLAMALFLGERTPTLRPLRKDLNALGLSHLIAVSGLHVGMLLGLLLSILRLPLLVTPRFALTGTLHHLVLLFGAAVTCWWCAWPVGGVRLLVWAATALIAPHRPLSVTGWVSLLALLCVRPELGADLGFILSHGISLALVHSLALRKSLFTVPLVAALASVPGLALVGLPSALLGVFANLLLVPLFVPVFLLSLLGIASGHAQGGAALAIFSDLLATIAGSTGAPLLDISLSIGLASAVVLATLALVRQRWSAACALLAVASIAPPIEPGMQVWMLPVGHGDLALVKHGATEVVIDTGPRGKRLENSLLPLLSGHPDLLVISHADQDHIGGAEALCRARQPKQIWSQSALPSPCNATQPAQTVTLGALRVSPLPAADDWLRGRNERSLVITIDAEGQRLLFLGDIGLDREMDLEGRIGRASVVKVPHHGSRSSSSASLIAETGASIALVGAAPGDRFGHPHANIVRRWREAGAKIEVADQAPRCWTFQSGRRPRHCAALDHLRRAPVAGRNLRLSAAKRRLQP